MDHQEVDSCPILAIHPDIIQTHILTCLDGPTLAAAGSATSQLHTLSLDDSLWRDICHNKWPSTAHPLLRHVINSFPFRHRSFYAAAMSSFYSPVCSRPPQLSQAIISAVDIHYKNKHLFSKVQEANTESRVWSWSPFRVELLDPTERLPMASKMDSDYLTCESALENNLTLSWILIDPSRTLATNLTSFVPIGVTRNWTNEEIEVRFGTILPGLRKGELVECVVVVSCEGWVKEDLHVKQVSLEIKDVEENKLAWMTSLIVLHEAMGSRERRKGYNEFTEMKRKTREMKHWRERRREVVEIVACFLIVLGFWVFVIIPVFLFVSHIFR